MFLLLCISTEQVYVVLTCSLSLCGMVTLYKCSAPIPCMAGSLICEFVFVPWSLWQLFLAGLFLVSVLRQHYSTTASIIFKGCFDLVSFYVLTFGHIALGPISSCGSCLKTCTGKWYRLNTVFNTLYICWYKKEWWKDCNDHKTDKEKLLVGWMLVLGMIEIFVKNCMWTSNA